MYLVFEVLPLIYPYYSTQPTHNVNKKYFVAKFPDNLRLHQKTLYVFWCVDFAVEVFLS